MLKLEIIHWKEERVDLSSELSWQVSNNLKAKEVQFSEESLGNGLFLHNVTIQQRVKYQEFN